MSYTSQDTVKAIQQAAPNNETALAMLTGSYLESGWDPNEAVTDTNGYTSAGPFMMNFSPGNWSQPPISGSQANAEDPYIAAAAIEPQYAQAAAAQGSLWQTNPSQAAEQAAQAAERPAESYYQSQGSSKVTTAYNAAVAALGGKNPSPTAPTGGGGSGGNQTTSYTNIGNPSTAVGNAVTGALPWPFGTIANLFGINSAITDIFPFFIGFVGLLLIVWGISIVAKGSGVTVNLPGGGGGGSQQGGMAKDAEHGAEDAAVVAA